MTEPARQATSRKQLALLSRLLLRRRDSCNRAEDAELKREIARLSATEIDDLLALANSNHVVVRGLETLLRLLRDQGEDIEMEWAVNALARECVRIEKATNFLHDVCAAFQEQQLNAIVIKSLDHWPDLGSDLDLYTDSAPEDVAELMRRRFDARIAPRSWGDRLACKWNFALPGLPELVEIHVGRLGQTGEQLAIASSLVKRAAWLQVGGSRFPVPSSCDRLLISALQRMYRHFYFRLCDIVDTAALGDAERIDYEDLRRLAQTAGIWEGVATYLAIVSDYLEGYRSAGLDMPEFVWTAARFRGVDIYFDRGFLRVPILPHSARLYGAQLAEALGKRELQCGARLSLLPWLATAAVIGQKLTGSDKGIW